MVMRRMRDEPEVIADVRYLEGEEHLIVAVDWTLSNRDVATAMLTDLVATNQDAIGLLDDIRDVAESMAWTVRVEADGGEAVVTVS
jgi:hypothetical protein